MCVVFNLQTNSLFYSSRRLVYGVKRPFQPHSFITCQSVLLVDETGVPGENHRPVASHCQTLSHIAVESSNKCLKNKKI